MDLAPHSAAMVDEQVPFIFFSSLILLPTVTKSSLELICCRLLCFLHELFRLKVGEETIQHGAFVVQFPGFRLLLPETDALWCG